MVCQYIINSSERTSVNVKLYLIMSCVAVTIRDKNCKNRIMRNFLKYWKQHINTNISGYIQIIDLWIVSRWCNGLARLRQWPCYLQGPGLESHLWPVEFFTCNKVSPLNNRTSMLTYVSCVPNYLAQSYQRHIYR